MSNRRYRDRPWTAADNAAKNVVVALTHPGGELPSWVSPAHRDYAAVGSRRGRHMAFLGLALEPHLELAGHRPHGAGFNFFALAKVLMKGNASGSVYLRDPRNARAPHGSRTRSSATPLNSVMGRNADGTIASPRCEATWPLTDRVLHLGAASRSWSLSSKGQCRSTVLEWRSCRIRATARRHPCRVSVEANCDYAWTSRAAPRATGKGDEVRIAQS